MVLRVLWVYTGGGKGNLMLNKTLNITFCTNDCEGVKLQGFEDREEGRGYWFNQRFRLIPIL